MLKTEFDTCLKMIKHYDPKLLNHCCRTATLAKAMAKLKGYKEETCCKMYTAGMIHDIGKIVMPPEILNKEGRLTKDERAMIDLHAFQGYCILKNFRFEDDVCQIVLFHHGYDKPRFCSVPNPENDIINLSNIMRVADAFDALTSERPYCAKMSSRKAIEIMLEDKAFSKENVSILTASVL